MSFKMLKTTIALCSFLLLFVFSCQQKQESNAIEEDYYFSLSRYFKEEAKRLSTLPKPIRKEVSRNSVTETKTIEIENWEKEFGLFIESDINKLSWKESYKKIENKDTLTYKSIDPELRTQRIVIVKNDQKITEIHIENITKNILYTSEENLVYFPDSLYTIDKQQDVVFIGNNTYRISGFLNP